MRSILALSVIICAGLVFSGCVTETGSAGASGGTAAGQPFFKDETGTIVHRPSGTPFPQKIGAFVFAGITIYDRVGENVSVGYNPQPGGGLWGVITAYVYPASDFSQEYDGVKVAIVLGNGDAKLISESEVVMQGVKGRYARFDYPKDLSDGTKEHFSSVYLFETGGWFVKFRVTYQKANADIFEKALETFFSRFRFPARDRRTGGDIRTVI
jgi:hypothetical protein